VAQRLVQIVYNPASGGYAPARVRALGVAFERHGAAVQLSPTSSDPIAIDPDADLLCVAGGDGTVRLATQALRRAGRDMAIAVYPTGTVNLLSREIGGDAGFERLAGRLLGADHRDCYGVTLNDTIFLVCASVGPEAWAVDGVSPALKRRIGRFAYAAALLPSLGRWPRIPIRLDVAGREIMCEAFYVAKGRYFAGRWTLSPYAGLAEQVMRLVILKTARRRDMARFWTRLALHRPVADLSFVEEIACAAFSADAALPLPVQADGDIAATLPARFQLIPEAFRFA
jgi:diacylglycerol kinase (ATP)